MSLLDGFFSLAGIGSIPDKQFKEGVAEEKISALALDVKDKELIELSTKWKEKWDNSSRKKELEKKQKQNENYWLGKQYAPSEAALTVRNLVDNLIFEALETALPFFTKQRGEPVVMSDGTSNGEELAKKVTQRIIDIADTMRLRLKVKKAVRHWALYYLGCLKVGWSQLKNEIDVQVIRPQNLILDPDAMTDECEYTGEYLGHAKEDVAENLIARFPKKEKLIKDKVNSKLGTKLGYTEWWSNDYVFWTMEGEVLDKAKNPHWNYDEDIEEEVTDEFGQVKKEKKTLFGTNHFSVRKMPFVFLSVFTLGRTPYDETTLVEQVLSIQDVINKRQRQIDRNADRMNTGGIFSGDAFTKEQAAQAQDAMNKGKGVWIPRGSVNTAYKRESGEPLPNFIYQSLLDYRNELRNIFGIGGLSSQGIKSEETVRGKILVRQTDADRNPLTDHLEQFYDYTFNWFVQLMMVYYDEPHRVSGSQGGTFIQNSEFNNPLIVSVKEGSLIPKDPLTKRNEAVDLWASGAIDVLTLMERLDDPNPKESAARLILWKTNPMAFAQKYTPEISQQLQQVAQQQAEQAAQAQGAGRGGKQPEQDLLGQVPIS